MSSSQPPGRGWSGRTAGAGLLAASLVVHSGCSLLSALKGVERNDAGGELVREDPVRAGLASPEEAAALRAPQDLTLVIKGEPCRGVLGNYDPDLELTKNLPNIACHLRFSEPVRPHSRVLHDRFDDRRYDPLIAAAMLVVCVGDRRCEGPVATGQMSYYAENTDAAAVDAALRRLAAPAAFKDVFRRRFAAASQLIRKRAADLDPRRRALYVEVPRQARARRAEHWERFAGLWARFDEIDAAARRALGGKDVPADLIDRVKTLRDDYVRACVQGGEALDTCYQGQLARPLTERIIQLAIATGQRLLGDAENATILDKADRSGASTDIWVAQYRAMEEERRKHAEWERASESGVDASTLKRMYGDPPPLPVDPGAAWHPIHSHVDYGPLLANLGGPAPERVEGVVQRVQHRGGTATIHFLDEVSRWDEHDCVDTHKLDRIENGRLIYQQRCRYKRTHTERRKIAPVQVDAASARGLGAGNHVLTLVGPDRQGTVVRAFVDDHHRDFAAIRGVAAG